MPIKRNIPLLFSDLKIHNKLIRPQLHGETIGKHLSYCPDIHLEHDQNSFSISFSALNYSEYGRVHYQYHLEGFDNYWVDARNNHEAYYANLPAGEYVFHVKITNNDRSIVEAENSIRIRVYPAPWRTWWATASTSCWQPPSPFSSCVPCSASAPKRRPPAAPAWRKSRSNG